MKSRLLLIIMVCLLAPNAALAGDCWELLTRASAWTDKWQAGAKEAGDVVAVQPAGAEWGAQERDTSKYRILTVCGSDGFDGRALAVSLMDASGNEVKQCRYTAIVSGAGAVEITDKTDNSAITVAGWAR